MWLASNAMSSTLHMTVVSIAVQVCTSARTVECPCGRGDRDMGKLGRTASVEHCSLVLANEACAWLACFDCRTSSRPPQPGRKFVEPRKIEHNAWYIG